jgi:hypothetical protein
VELPSREEERGPPPPPRHGETRWKQKWYEKNDIKMNETKLMGKKHVLQAQYCCVYGCNPATRPETEANQSGKQEASCQRVKVGALVSAVANHDHQKSCYLAVTTSISTDGDDIESAGRGRRGEPVSETIHGIGDAMGRKFFLPIFTLIA